MHAVQRIEGIRLAFEIMSWALSDNESEAHFEVSFQRNQADFLRMGGYPSLLPRLFLLSRQPGRTEDADPAQHTYRPDAQILGHLLAHIMSSDYSCLSLFGANATGADVEIKTSVRHGSALPLLLAYALGAGRCFGREKSHGKQTDIAEAAKQEERFTMGQLDGGVEDEAMLVLLINTLTQVASVSVSNLFSMTRHLPQLPMWLITRIYGPAEERQYAVTFPPRDGWSGKPDEEAEGEVLTWQAPSPGLRRAYLGLLRKVLEGGVSREVTWRLFTLVRKDQRPHAKSTDSSHMSPAASGRGSPSNGLAKRKRAPHMLKLRMPSEETAAQETIDVEVLDLLQHAMKARWPPAFVFGGGHARPGGLELKETGRTWPKSERGLHFSVSESPTRHLTTV